MVNYKKYLEVTPYEYQNVGAAFALSHHYCIIADEMGLGKTLQALIVIIEEALKGKKTLIVCPAFLRNNWEAEIRNLSAHYHWVNNLAKRKDIPSFDPRSCINIISYSSVSQSRKLFEWADIVVADEAHYLKEMTTKRTVDFHRFVYEETPERLLLLTGTPMPNGVTELYSLLLLMSYTLRKTNGLDISKKYPLPEDFYQRFAFERTFDIKVKGGGRRSITRYEGRRNVSELKRYLKDKMIRRKCDEVLDLPPILDIPVVAEYDNNPELLKAFNEFKKNDKTSPEVKAKSALMKADFTAQYARNIVENGTECVLIYTDHIKSGERLSKLLDDAPFIQGSMSMDKRQKLKEKFQRGEIPYLVVSIGAGAEGLTFTRSSDIIFNDYNWVPSKIEQVRKRIHRIGQVKTCRIHNVIGSIQDDKIIKSLVKKLNDIREVLNEY